MLHGGLPGCNGKRFQVFILLILLLHWQQFFDLSQSAEYHVLEYYAGVGRIGRLSAGLGYRAGCYDVAYDDPKHFESWPSSPRSKQRLRKPRASKKSAMDLTTSAGFVRLGSSKTFNIYQLC